MQVSVTARTAMSAGQKRRAASRLEALERLAPGRVLEARVCVQRDDNPRIAQPYRAEGEIDVNGRIVRAHVVGPSTGAVLDSLADRLEGRLRRAADRRIDRRRETGEATLGHWRHADLPTRRSAFFPRAPQERRVIRRRTLAPEPMTLVQAAADMLDLD